MPFTFAHPAAAVPLLRVLGRHGSLSALAIGSIAPDLAFIVPLGLARGQTHSPAALFLFCLPAGLVTYCLFHALFKAPLLALMPERIASRIHGGQAAPWSAVLISLLCGAVTHLLWDGFTHPGTLLVDALPVLQAELSNVGGYHVYAYKVLQHASSLMGLALLARWALRWRRQTTPDHTLQRHSLTYAQRMGALLTLASVPLLAGLAIGWRHCHHISNLADLQIFATGFIFSALPTAALMLTLYSVSWKIRLAYAA